MVLTSKANLQYLMNHLRFVQTLTEDQYYRFPTGTCGNESLHRELNAVSRETTKRFQYNFYNWLQVMRLRRQFLHTEGLRASHLGSHRPQDLMMKTMAGFQLFQASTWDEWCRMQSVPVEELGKGMCPFTKVKTPRATSAMKQVQQVSEWKKQELQRKEKKRYGKLKKKLLVRSVSLNTLKKTFLLKVKRHSTHLYGLLLVYSQLRSLRATQ